MFGFPSSSTKAALLVEHIDENGEKKVLIYQMGMPLSVSVDYEYNVWDFRDSGNRVRPHSTRVTIDGYLTDPRVYGQSFPDNQEEIDPPQKAIESSESEIVIEKDEYERWENEHQYG